MDAVQRKPLPEGRRRGCEVWTGRRDLTQRPEAVERGVHVRVCETERLSLPADIPIDGGYVRVHRRELPRVEHEDIAEQRKAGIRALFACDRCRVLVRLDRRDYLKVDERWRRRRARGRIDRDRLSRGLTDGSDELRILQHLSAEEKRQADTKTYANENAFQTGISGGEVCCQFIVVRLEGRLRREAGGDPSN